MLCLPGLSGKHNQLPEFQALPCISASGLSLCEPFKSFSNICHPKLTFLSCLAWVWTFPRFPRTFLGTRSHHLAWSLSRGWMMFSEECSQVDMLFFIQPSTLALLTKFPPGYGSILPSADVSWLYLAATWGYNPLPGMGLCNHLNGRGLQARMGCRVSSC